MDGMKIFDVGAESFSEEQEEFLVGNLLGDGSLSRLKDGTSQNSVFSITQKSTRVVYLDGLKSVYSPFIINKVKNKVKSPTCINGKISHDHWNGKYTESYTIYTVAHKLFSNLRLRWYKNPYQKSYKIVPKDIKITWRTLSTWVCDDGTNNCGKTFTLCTDGFTTEEVEFLIYRLKIDLDLHGNVGIHCDKPQIKFYKMDEIKKLVDGIREFVPYECFSYKLISRTPTSRVGMVLKSNVSGCVGVSYSQGLWRAKGREKHLGSFKYKQDAIAARRAWEEEIRSETIL